MSSPPNATSPARLIGRLAGLIAKLAAPALFAQTNPAPAESVVTNFVTVTNTVILTNYVVATNLVFTTNRPPSSPASSLDWEPTLGDGFDWIQLNTGEWLKGYLKAIQDREVEFDSEKLKFLTFEWKDIRRVISSRWNNLLFTPHRRASGAFQVTPTEVIVGGTEPEVYPRSALISATPGGKKERNFWSGQVAVGLSLHSGNGESVDYNASATLQRRTPATRFKLDYLGNISSADGTQNANNQRVNTEFDIWLSSRLYLITPMAEYFHDPFQNIDHRAYVGVGAGYDIIQRPNMEWNVFSGPAYQRTWFSSVEAGQDPTSSSAALIFGTRFDWDITRRLELILEFRGQYTSREVGETSTHAVATLEIELTKRLELDVSFIWDRIADPKTGADGLTPEPNDYRLVLSFGARF